MKKVLYRLVAAVAALLLSTPVAWGVGSQDEQNILRVGYPAQAGLSDWEDGQPVGYTYDYLREVAQYTGWDYEFVRLENMDAQALLELLESGRLDLVGGLCYDENLAQQVEYTSLSYGSVSRALEVLEHNTALTRNNLQMVGRIRVGVPEDDPRAVRDLEEFCQKIRLEVELVYLPAQDTWLSPLEKGEVDALLCTDFCVRSGLRQVAKFSPAPVYLAAAKGNTAITELLDISILMINECDPGFSAQLNEKYLGAESTELELSEAERAYINQRDTLRVIYNPNKPPLQYQDENGDFAGVSRSVYDYLAQKTGLSFVYVPVADQSEAAQMLRNGQADLIAEIASNQDNANFYHTAMSRSYLSSQIAIVMGSGMEPDQLSGKLLAIPADFIYSGTYFGDVMRYATEQECIQAVARGEADYTYSNIYSAPYYISQSGFHHVQMVPQSGLDRNYCIGVAKPVDMELLSILNKTIRSISTETLQAMIYQNAFQEQTYTFSSYLEHNPKVMILLVSAPALLVIAALALAMAARERFNRRLTTENERYRQICALSGECLYEYDYAKDRLTLSGQNAQFFGEMQHYEQFRRTITDTCTDSRQEVASFLDVEGTRELLLRMPNGTSRWFRAVGNITRDKGGTPVYHVGKLVDIQSEKEELRALEERAQRDSLTGAYNAAACRHIISDRLDRTGGGALLIIDLDHFKQVNDEYGHYTGDQVLMAVAETLMNLFRRGDVVGRQGGDEFLVFMANLDSQAVVEEKCRAILRDCARMTGRTAGVTITLSIGVAMVDDCQEYEVVYRRADRALYAAKKNGRNSYVLHDRNTDDC